MGYYSENLPPRVRAALEVLEHCRNRQDGSCCDPGGNELSRPEEAMQRQALQVLTLYLAGEMDYGDEPPTPRKPPDDEPGATQPVTV
ncbi:MAG: hypothetical protein KF864_00665 [Phycisphaeraceae bacterium]|nr:hypothetical protein [Phycisphaeraceae bacterium]MBX3410801.1 hypothetical protein [Phycisphaeraceae bacterium]